MNTPVTVTPGEKPIKVVILCHSDNLGGAAVVTYRLAAALRRAGVDARMLVYTKVSESENVDLVGSRFSRGVKFLAERLRIFLANGCNKKNLFKVSVANVGMNFHNHHWVREADVVMLSWVNQGMLSFGGLEKICSLGKPVVWTMHDMWNLTGICHHAYECTAYKEQCGNCQYLTGTHANDLSRAVWRRKKQFYESHPITFVAVSNWLAEKCRESSLLAGADLRVIPNAFPVDNFITANTHRISSLNIDYSRRIILMGAARLDDPIKGINYAIEALNYIFDNHPNVAATAQIVFFGEINDKSILDRLRFPRNYIGRVNDWRLIRQLYAAADVVLSTSLYETLPGTLIEGQASGCLPVSFGRGGQSDIIDHLKNGYIAEYKNSESIAKGIMWALAQKPDRNRLHEEVRERFSSSKVAEVYKHLFAELLERSAKQKSTES